MTPPTSIRKDGSPTPLRSRLVGGSFKATGMFLRNQLWAWPLIAAAILAVLGFWLRGTIERVMKAQMAESLRTVLNGDVQALRLLFRAYEALTTIAAADPQIRELAREVIAAGSRGGAEPVRSPKAAELRAALGPWLRDYEYTGFLVLDHDGLIAAAHRDDLIGMPFNPAAADAAAKVLGGKATVSRPFSSRVVQADANGLARAGAPVMYAAAPFLGQDGKVFGALCFALQPETSFTRILNVARFGASGETYAFDRSGLLLSESRFDDDLKRLGLIADRPDVRSTLNLDLRDPGIDLMAGGRTAKRRREQPLTLMVAESVRGGTGVDVFGHHDYRGVPSIGAWTWLPEYGFGVATEVDQAEAYHPLSILRAAFWSMFALLGVAAVALFVFTVLMARLRFKLRKEALDARRLGRYSLDEKIGEGGMGSVFRAHHAMLHRPTAIKLLSPEKTNEASIARFEREVQLTSGLNHPNTITIYDYGRTPEGIFYYAMEFLDGLDLEALVERDGPQPEGRVVNILAQVCGSLAEAHSIGLIHRDIKPANILLNRRGGVADFVKVVDFGLVKAVDQGRAAGLTSTGSIVGTPLYMPPEAIEDAEHMGPRGDLYAVGAVGYFLLTGRPLFEGRSLMELLNKQVNQPPMAPSDRLGRPVSADLENLLLRCLAKRADDRFATAGELAEALRACIVDGAWTTAEAEAWWRAYAADRPATPDNPPPDPSVTVFVSNSDEANAAAAFPSTERDLSGK